jgi:hypothetical protein
MCEAFSRPQAREQALQVPLCADDFAEHAGAVLQGEPGVMSGALIAPKEAAPFGGACLFFTIAHMRFTLSKKKRSD